MPPLFVGLVVVSVCFSAAAQIFLKQGMSQPAVQLAFLNGSKLEILSSVALSWGVWVGLSLYIGSMVVWLGVLSKIDVTQAYPFVGLGFLITLAFGYFYLGEQINMMRLFGTILVASGVVLVASS